MRSEASCGRSVGVHRDSMSIAHQTLASAALCIIVTASLGCPASAPIAGRNWGWVVEWKVDGS